MALCAVGSGKSLSPMQGVRRVLIHIPTRILIQIDEAPGWPKMNKDGQSVLKFG